MRATVYVALLLASITPTLAAKDKLKRKCPAPTTPDPPQTIPPEPMPTPSLPELPPSNGVELPPCIGTSCYIEAHRWVGADFYNDWEFFNQSDAANVNYVDMDTAKSRNMTYASEGSFIMRADFTTVPTGGAGRDSVRISTKFDSFRQVAVLDVRHMPEGKGTWPAYWTIDGQSPINHEMHIIEGVNDTDRNRMSLHLSGGCMQLDGTHTPTGCVEGDNGCGIFSPSEKSFGRNFNANGGGWYATEQTGDVIRVWFWERDHEHVPADVQNGEQWLATDQWGAPAFEYNVFPFPCNLSRKFSPSTFVISLSFCGDWNENGSDGDVAACKDFVDNNPTAFVDAYWDIARMSLYEYVYDA